jgi:hypothetical protein
LFVAFADASHHSVPADVVGEVSEYRDFLQENSYFTGTLRHRDKIPASAVQRISAQTFHLGVQNAPYAGFRFPLQV